MNRYSWKWRRGALALLIPLAVAGCGPVEHLDQRPALAARLETDPTAPTASLFHPTVGQPVTGTINFGVEATDDAGVTRVDIFVDGAIYLSRSYTATPSVSFFQYWDSTTTTEGPHTVQVRAYDGSNKVGESTPVEFFVDRTAPTATLTSPADGATVGGRFVTVTAATEDAHGIGWVDLLVDGSVYAQASEPPYTLTWDTTYFSGGTYTLSVRAHDVAGNVTESTPVQVQLPADTQAPMVSIVSPAEGTSVSGMMWVTADATDDRQVMFLELLVDGMPVAMSTMASQPIYWDTTSSTNGPHTLEVRARDFAGNVAVSAPVHVIFDNSTPPPPPLPPSTPGNAVYDASRGAPGCGLGQLRRPR
jgi:chitinase